jgi:ABC-type transport system substrate-binding protein
LANFSWRTRGRLHPLTRGRSRSNSPTTSAPCSTHWDITRAPFMMPARIASTSAEEQITEIVGSGPFKFARDEWQPGEQVVYVRNPDYIPRDEAPSGSTGGKKVFLDKVIWRYIPDPWDAAEDLAAGKVDWWEQPPLDFIPKIERNPELQTFVIDPLGTQGWLQPNCLHPPFNNKKAREALLHMMDQVTYLAWAIGQEGAARQGRLEPASHMVAGRGCPQSCHFGVSGAGPRAWFGWPDIPQLDKLVTDWLRATDQTKLKQLADEVQKVAFSDVPYVPWGEWVQPTAFRKNVRDVLKFGAPIFWNVKVT